MKILIFILIGLLLGCENLTDEEKSQKIKELESKCRTWCQPKAGLFELDYPVRPAGTCQCSDGEDAFIGPDTKLLR